MIEFFGLKDLVSKMLKGDRLSLSRLITQIENRSSDLGKIMQQLYKKTGRAQIWGITGPPGSGKSTRVDGMISLLRKDGLKIAVIAIDPTSPFTGGAVLGDRVRMQKHAEDLGVFIRSIGTRGRHGGLSHSTKEVVLCLEAAGFDIIIVETAGVGQTELDILQLAQTVLVVLVPESGDGIQVMKAGIMEIADLFLVNKSDRPEADLMVKELNNLEPSDQAWKPPVHKTEATRQLGLKDVLASVQDHQEYLVKSGLDEKKRLEFLKGEIVDILIEKVSKSVLNYLNSDRSNAMLLNMKTKKLSPYAVAEKISKLLS